MLHVSLTEIQDVLKNDNARRGVEHARVLSMPVETPATPAKSQYVNKDGKVCGAVVHGRCHEVWVDSDGRQYVNGAGKPCNPASYIAASSQDICQVLTADGKPLAKTVWFKTYTEKVVQYGFDVKTTDSLVTPYTGVLSYSEVAWFTTRHPTKEEAEQDNNFTPPLTSPRTRTFGYQDGKWVLLK